MRFPIQKHVLLSLSDAEKHRPTQTTSESVEHRFSGIAVVPLLEPQVTSGPDAVLFLTNPPRTVDYAFSRKSWKISFFTSLGNILKSLLFDLQIFAREVRTTRLSSDSSRKLKTILTDSSSFNAQTRQNQRESLRFPLKIKCVRHGFFGHSWE